MDKYFYIFSAVFILVGLFLCCFGKKFEKITIVLVIGVFVSYFITLIVLNFIPSIINTEKRLWILLGGAFLVGGFIGFLLRAKLTAFTCLLGCSAGYTIGEFVYQFVQSFIDWNPQYLYYITIGVCCVAGIILGLVLLKAIMIISTSILGGYIAMRGVTIIFGNYIDEGQFVDLIKNGEYEQLEKLRNGWVYAYLGLWVFLSLFGVYYQCCKDKKDSSKNYKKIEN